MGMLPCKKNRGACCTGLQELHSQNRTLVPLLGFFSKFSTSTPVLSMWESRPLPRGWFIILVEKELSKDCSGCMRIKSYKLCINSDIAAS